MTPDRRSHPRYPTRISATIVCDEGLSRIPALVVDQSESGVRVQLEEDRLINSQCYLLFDHRIEPFQVIWQARRTAGLAFTS